MKRIAIHILIVIILCGVFCDGYFTLSQLSCGRVWLSDSEVYAADNWEAVTQDDLVTAFQYYCKSRNLTIDGSIADALTSFTTTTFNNICKTLGIDVTSLQANLKKTVEGNLGLRFLMNQQGVLAYNRIFAEFLQNNDLTVGDTVDNKVLDIYKYYTDNNGNSCLIYIVNTTVGSGTLPSNNIIQKGSLLQSGQYFYNLFSGGTTSYTYDNYSYTIRNNSSNSNYPTIQVADTRSSGMVFLSVYGYHGSSHYPYFDCGSSIFSVNNTLYYGFIYYYIRTSDNITFFSYRCPHALNNDNGIEEDGTVNITTNNNTINNNNYNNNYTIIYNDGDTYITGDDDEPSPTTPPEGGGGGGDDPDQPSPSGPDLPDWGSPHGTGTIGSDGTFDFDIPFSLPDLNIDWSLKNIGDKFPFCIPSDIVSFYQVLAVEPEAPAIDAHIPLGSFYDWHFEADFSQYDNWARIIRIVEYVGFVITLIYFTVKLVKG